MFKISKAKQFILSIFILLVIIAISYKTYYESLLIEPKIVEYNYRDFLLKNTNAPRLIIEGGSNGMHEISTKMMEEKLGMMTINLGDNVIIPLRHKLLRLEKYIKPDDIVLLPLGWVQYSMVPLPSLYTHNFFVLYSMYYKYLTFVDKVKLMSNTAFFSTLIAGSLEQHEKYSRIINNIIQRKAQLNRFATYESRFLSGDHGNLKSLDGVVNDVKFMSCDDYIFSYQLKNGFEISDIFKENMQIVKRLQKKGIKFLFTWQAVAGDECYLSKYREQANVFKEKIEKYMKANDMPLIGSPFKNKFSSQYTYDTYAHIRPEGRKIHTKNLINTIKKSNYYSWFKDKNISSDRLNTNYETIKDGLARTLVPLKEKSVIYFDKDRFEDSRVLLLEGWYEFETWGVWSEGEMSKLIVKLDDVLANKTIKMKLKSKIFFKKDKTELFINGKRLGHFLLDGLTEITIPKSFTSIKGDILEIEFKNINIKSPIEAMGPKAGDSRKIKLGIESLSFQALE